MSKALEHVFKIVDLYPEHMNMYGDTGNSIVLQKRFELYGLQAEIVHHNVGSGEIPDADVVLGGGGQDSCQLKIVDDLLDQKEKLHTLAEQNVPMLVICGMYQLFGKHFRTSNGEKIEGLDIIDVHTDADKVRLIGNIITESDDFGTLIGYENHSGQTFLGENAIPLAQNVTLGEGNNVTDTTEGARYRNVIGTYLHGPCLPKNPALADFLITAAVSNIEGQNVQLTAHNTIEVDYLASLARSFVNSR